MTSIEVKERLREAVERHGSPLYVYDLDQIDHNLRYIRDAFGPEVRIQYACKALMNGHVLRHLLRQGCGVDTVSREEIEIALHYGFSAAQVNYTPSGAPLDEYLWALRRGVMVHIDNLGVLDKVGKAHPCSHIAIRFNPKVRSGGHTQLQVGAEDSKFGLYTEEFTSAEEIVRKYGFQVKRIHVHVGSDVKTEDDFVKCWTKSFELAARFGDTVDTLDLGGGYGVKYHAEDQSIDMHDLGKRIKSLAAQYSVSHGKEVALMLEPGKSLVGNAGFFLVRVTGIKNLSDRKLVYVDSGFNHFIRPMYYGAQHFIENLSRPVGQHEAVKIVGYLCETDTFSERSEIAAPQVGDILCFHNTGAYSMSMASNYNSRLKPAEVVLQGGQLTLSRRRETIADLLICDQNL